MNNLPIINDRLMQYEDRLRALEEQQERISIAKAAIRRRILELRGSRKNIQARAA